MILSRNVPIIPKYIYYYYFFLIFDESGLKFQENKQKNKMLKIVLFYLK